MDIDKLLEMNLTFGDADWKPTPHGRLLAEILAVNNLVKDKIVLSFPAYVVSIFISVLK